MPTEDDLTALDDVTVLPPGDDAPVDSRFARLTGIGGKPLLVASIGAAAVVAGALIVRSRRSN